MIFPLQSKWIFSWRKLVSKSVMDLRSTRDGFQCSEKSWIESKMIKIEKITWMDYQIFYEYCRQQMFEKKKPSSQSLQLINGDSFHALVWLSSRRRFVFINDARSLDRTNGAWVIIWSGWRRIPKRDRKSTLRQWSSWLNVDTSK